MYPTKAKCEKCKQIIRWYHCLDKDMILTCWKCNLSKIKNIDHLFQW